MRSERREASLGVIRTCVLSPHFWAALWGYGSVLVQTTGRGDFVRRVPRFKYRQYSGWAFASGSGRQPAAADDRVVRGISRPQRPMPMRISLLISPYTSAQIAVSHKLIESVQLGL